MDHASKWGGTVQTEWMKKLGVPAYNAGAGQFAWQREQIALDMEGARAQSRQQMTQLGWQLQDLDIGNQQRLVRAGWQRADFATQAGRNAYNYRYQMQQFAYQGQEMQLQHQYYEEDFAFNRQVSQLQFGWQMQDLNEGIRRSTGYQRKQLVRQKDRETEMHDLQTQQEDRVKKRQEEAYKRQEDQFKKEVDHYKQTAKWADEDLKKAKDRFEQEQKWADEDYSRKRGRIVQEMGWAAQAAERTERSYKIRLEQIDAEESAAKANEALAAIQRDEERKLEDEKFKLSQQIIGITKEEQAEQRALQIAIQTMRTEEQRRVEAFQKTQIDFYNSIIMWMMANGAQGLSFFHGGTLGETQTGENVKRPEKALGGRLNTGDIVGEIGPEIVVSSGDGATVIPTRALTPRGSSFSDSPITVEANAPIQIDGQTVATVLLKFLIDPAQLQQRRRLRR
jgi:hypothetical protein